MSMTTDWQVETLRITVFPTEMDSVSVAPIWDSLIGLEPDETHIQRGKVDARIIEYGNGRLILDKVADRVSFRYLSSPLDEQDSLQLPIIGSLESELVEMTRLAEKWFASSVMPSIKRFAFGAVLLHPVSDKEEGYSFLRTLLPNMDLHNVRDFNYRVNRRRNSCISKDLMINRLSTWSVFEGQLIDLEIGPSSIPQSTVVTGLNFASRLELDINTWWERREPLSPDNLGAVFDELVELGLEISEQGDIA